MAAGTYTYAGNLNPTDGTTELVVAWGTISLGGSGTLTAGEYTELSQNYKLLAGAVEVPGYSGVYTSPSGTGANPTVATPSGSVTTGTLVNGAAPSSLLATDNQGNLISGPPTAEVVNAVPLAQNSLQQLPILTTATTGNSAVIASHNPYDATAAPIAVSLPVPATGGILLSVEKFDTGSNSVSISGMMRGIEATIALSLAHETIMFESDDFGNWWVIGGNKTLASLTTYFQTLVNASLASNSTVAAAAAAAVASATSAGGFVAGGVTQDPISSFAVVDGVGHKSFVDVGYDGHPTLNSITLIIAALAANPTALAALEAELATAFPEVYANNVDTNYVFSITDVNGLRSWLEFGPDGHPTTNAVNLISEAIAANPTQGSALSSALQTANALGVIAGLSYVVVDSQNNRSDIELDLSGHISARVMALWQARIGINPGSVTMADMAADSIGRINTTANYQWEITNGALYVNNLVTGQRTLISTGNSPVFQEFTADGYVLWTDSQGSWACPVGGGVIIPQTGSGFTAVGDSITWGQNSQNGNSQTLNYPGVLSSLLGKTVTNLGYPGFSSTDIGINQGGVQPQLTITNNQIPAGAPAAIAVTTIVPSTSYRSGASTTFSWNGSLAGVPGVLQHNMAGSTNANNGVATWTFTPTSTVATAVTVPPGTPFIGSTGSAYRANTQIFWSGRNNFDAGENVLNDVPRDNISYINYMTPRNKRFLVMSFLNAPGENIGTGNYNTIVAYGQAMAAAYPNNYLDIREELVQNGLSFNGLTPTSQDVTDMANDNIPTQLRDSPSDVHLNAYGYNAVAHFVYTWLLAKGWTN